MRTPIRHWRLESDLRSRARRLRTTLRLGERLEARCLLSTGAGVVVPAVAPSFPSGGFFGRLGGLGGGGGNTIQQSFGPSSPVSTSLTPAQIQGAYGYSSLFSGSSSGTYNTLAGKGTTIAIIDAYIDPAIANDASKFSTQYNLPQFDGANGDPTLTIKALGSQVDTTGGWELETALDVEWAHAIAPAANILLVEAASASTTDLLNAVQVADKTPGVVAVSMSWGGSELGIPANADAAYFSTPGIAYFAASGDSGAGAEWPAASASVVGVGGTNLTVNGTAYVSESGWGESGGGPSRVVSQPQYQQAYTGPGSSVLASTNNRGTPDVAFDASPQNGSGLAVYDSYESITTTRSFFGSTTNEQEYNWTQIGGTSVGTPSWAATAAIADGIRLQAGGTSLSGGSQFLPALYAIGASGAYGTDFNDVTTGNNGYPAGTGYDFVTGLGSPKAAGLVASLASVTGAGSGVTFAAASTVSNAVARTPIATPHDIPITIITIVTLPLPGSSSNAPIQTPSPTSSPTTPAPTPGQTQPVLVTVVSLSPGGAVSSSAIVVVFAPLNPAALSSTATPAPLHTALATAGESGVPGVTVLTATTSINVRPPQSLDARPAFDRDQLLRLPEEIDPFAPLDYRPPVAPGEFVRHHDLFQGLDLIAIMRQAVALGRVAEQGGGGGAAPFAPPAVVVPTDLNQHDRAAPLDPALAAAVVVVGGVLAVKVSSSDARRRPWLPLPLGR
jgi:hypothetical protein